MNRKANILDVMQSLGDSTRARTLRLLERHELTVAELCNILQLPQSTVSRHLKVLADAAWVTSRRDGTSRLYRMTPETGEPATRKLWLLIREDLAGDPATDRDERRLERVLAARQTRSEQFFKSAAGQWDHLRDELFGSRFDLHGLLGLLDPSLIVADLGCGTGQNAEALAPFVQQVIAIDSSTAMLTAARKRLQSLSNVDLRKGTADALPLDDQAIDAAILSLVLHHIAQPERALAELARALRPGGRLLILDMHAHERSEYQQQMGHVWLGFDPVQLTDWITAAGFTPPRIVSLPADPTAKGPGLFVATATKT